MEGQTTCKGKKRLKYKNSENVSQLEVTEAILVNCNLVNNIRTRLVYEKKGPSSITVSPKSVVPSTIT